MLRLLIAEWIVDVACSLIPELTNSEFRLYDLTSQSQVEDVPNGGCLKLVHYL